MVLYLKISGPIWTGISNKKKRESSVKRVSDVEKETYVSIKKVVFFKKELSNVLDY